MFNTTPEVIPKEQDERLTQFRFISKSDKGYVTTEFDDKLTWIVSSEKDIYSTLATLLYSSALPVVMSAVRYD